MHFTIDEESGSSDGSRIFKKDGCAIKMKETEPRGGYVPIAHIDLPLLAVINFIGVLLLTGYCTTKLGIAILCTHKIRFPFTTNLWLIIAITPCCRSDYTDYTGIEYKYVMQ